MELQQLRYFLAVADNHSMSGASADLDITQSTISQAIHALERELGALLFHRVGRGMTLTSAGHALVSSARRILREAAAARDGAHGESASRGRLDIAASSTAVNGPLSLLLSACLHRFPDITVHIRDLGDAGQTVDVLASGQSEFVCTTLPLPGGGPTGRAASRLDTVEIGFYDVYVVFPPGRPHDVASTVALSDLPDVPMVLVPPRTGRYADLEEALALGQRRLTTAAVVEQREARMGYVLAGVGATFLGTRPAQDAARLGAHVHEVEPPFRQTVGLVFDRDRLSPVAQAFLGLAEDGAWRGDT